MLPQLLSCAYSYKYLEVLWLPKRTQLWACFNTEPNRLYRRLRLFPSKLQEYTPPPFSRLSTQYHIDPLLTCFLSLDTSRTSLRLQQSTKFSNRHTAHGRYEYSYNLANSRENWAQKKKNRPPAPICSRERLSSPRSTLRYVILLNIHKGIGYKFGIACCCTLTSAADFLFPWQGTQPAVLQLFPNYSVDICKCTNAS